MAGIASGIYNAVIRRNAVFVGTIFVSAFALQIAFDKTSDRLWDTVNKGRQWKDIKSRYVQQEGEEEE